MNALIYIRPVYVEEGETDELKIPSITLNLIDKKLIKGYI